MVAVIDSMQSVDEVVWQTPNKWSGVDWSALAAGEATPITKRVAANRALRNLTTIYFIGVVVTITLSDQSEVIAGHGEPKKINTKRA